MYYSKFQSPLGEILLTGTETGLSGLYTADHVRLPTAPGDRNDELFLDAVRQLTEYFDGQRLAFALPLDPPGTGFQRRVWGLLAEIPYGQTRSYGELAAELGQPAAARAVGLANGRNPISIVVPCHRVVGRSGALTGYAGGLSAKRWLLNHEARVSLAA